MSEFNKRIIIIGSLIIAVFAIFRLTGNKEVIVETQDSPISEQTFKEEFMVGCSEGDPEWEVTCSCAYDSLVSQVGIGGLVDLGIKYEETGEFPEEIMNGILNCL